MSQTALDIQVVCNTGAAKAELVSLGAVANESLGGGGKLGKAAKEGEGALTKAGKGAGSFLSGLTGLSPKMLEATAIAAGLAAVADGVAKAWEANEAAMTTLKQSMKDAGEKDTPAFEKALRKAQLAGEDLGFSQADTTDVMGKLTLAGVNQADAFKQLPVIMDLARAKNISLTDATAIYTKGIAGSAKGLKDLNVVGLETLPTTGAISAAHAKLAADIAKYGVNSAQARAEQEKLNTTLNTAAIRTHNLAIMHDELDKKVGGQAKAHTKDLSVEWASLSARFNDFAGQAIPYVLKGVTAVLAGITAAIPTIAGVIGAVVNIFRGLIAFFQGPFGQVLLALFMPVMFIVPFVVTHITPIIGIFKSVIGTVGTIVGGITGFFKTVFGGVSSTIGGFAGAIANAVKAVVNPVITIIDLFISGINILISGVNKVVGAIPFVGSHLQIGMLGQIPHLAAGGIAHATPGGILALLGEHGQDEAVTPLPTGWQTGSASRPGARTINVTVNAQTNADPNAISRAAVRGLRAGARAM